MLINYIISEPTKWNNYHSETWEGLCATGQAQSPIDIKTRETSGLVMDDFGLDQFSQWQYGGTIENNGNTLNTLARINMVLRRNPDNLAAHAVFDCFLCFNI